MTHGLAVRAIAAGEFRKAPTGKISKDPLRETLSR
jgi:hypothetical protein